MTDSAFHPTHWTLVLRTRGESDDAKTALSDLCAAYYAPVVAFLRRDGRGEDWANDQAHAFFETLLVKGVGNPDPELGRFRNYLLGALKHFLSKERDAALAAKRGGGAEHVPLEAELEAGAPDDTLIFDREWAHTLIARALATLESEQAGKAEILATLKPWLDGGTTGSQAEAAEALQMSETAVKVAIHRLRVRFRELIRAEVAATVEEPENVVEELRHLISIASSE